MGNTELIIKIPEEIRRALINNVQLSMDQQFICDSHIKQAIINSTPLPKGHGDLIDVNRKITVSTYDEQYEEWGAETLTVLEVLNSWSDEGVTEKDIIIQADKAETKQVGNPDRLEEGD